MGSNRPGTRRSQRLKRAKRHQARLAQKAQAQAQGASTEEPKGVVAKVTDTVKSAVGAVGHALKAAAEKITGHGE